MDRTALSPVTPIPLRERLLTIIGVVSFSSGNGIRDQGTLRRDSQ